MLLPDVVAGAGATVTTVGGATTGGATSDVVGVDVVTEVEVTGDGNARAVDVGEAAVVCTAATGADGVTACPPAAAARIPRLSMRPIGARTIAGGQYHQRFHQGLPVAVPTRAVRFRRMPSGPRRTRHSQKVHLFHHGFRGGMGRTGRVDAFMTLSEESPAIDCGSILVSLGLSTALQHRPTTVRYSVAMATCTAHDFEPPNAGASARSLFSIVAADQRTPRDLAVRGCVVLWRAVVASLGCRAETAALYAVCLP